jgi:hypothetical protein
MGVKVQVTQLPAKRVNNVVCIRDNKLANLYRQEDFLNTLSNNDYKNHSMNQGNILPNNDRQQ